MAVVARMVVAALFSLALQTNEVASFGRATIDTQLGDGIASVGTNMENQAEDNLEYGAGELTTSEAQSTDLLLGDLASAETVMRGAAMNITTSNALELISNHRGTPPAVMALVQQQLEHKQPGYAGVQKGQDMLNQLIQEAQEKLDLERQQCYVFIKAQSHQIWVTVQDIRMYDARAAKAREEVLAAQTEIQRLSELLPKLTETL